MPGVGAGLGNAAEFPGRSRARGQYDQDSGHAVARPARVGDHRPAGVDLDHSEVGSAFGASHVGETFGRPVGDSVVAGNKDKRSHRFRHGARPFAKTGQNTVVAGVQAEIVGNQWYRNIPWLAVPYQT